jgi:hypothetical protein
LLAQPSADVSRALPLELAWEDHGFRGPLGTIGKTQSPMQHTRMLETIDAVLPMPEAAAMLALIDHSAA